MSELPSMRPPPSREPPAPMDAELPLEALDRALGPVRRVVRYAVESGRRSAFLGEISERHLRVASGLPVPDALREAIDGLCACASGLDAEPDEAVAGERVAALFAGLARLDAVAGLPVRRSIRPVPKARVDYGAPDGTAGSMPAGSVPGDKAPADKAPADRGASLPKEPSARGEAPKAEGARAEGGGGRGDRAERGWNGRLDASLAELFDEPQLAECALEDLLLQVPSSEEVHSVVHGAGRELPVGRVAVGGRARGRVTVCQPDGRRRSRSLLVGAAGLWVEWGEPAPHRSLVVDGERLVVVGAWGGAGQVLLDAEVVRANADGVVVVANYDVDDTIALTPRARRYALLRIADRFGDGLVVRDPVSQDVLRRLDLPNRGAAVLALHRSPSGSRERQRGRRRMAFDEVLCVALATGAGRYPAQADRGIPHTLLQSGAAALSLRHDLRLTDEQQAVFEEIKRDLRRGSPMRRVLTGEVGGGKGTIALVTAVMVAEGKSQVLVLGPDESEIEQRFQHSEPILRDLGITARRVDDDPSRAHRDAIKRGEIAVVFGTHALLDADLSFRKLGLIISVERFPFGAAVAPPAGMGPRPDLLVVTQIPVGSRVLMTAYADFDVSVVVDARRRPAEIRVAEAARRPEAYALLREHVAAGHQGLVMFPRVRNVDVLDVAGAQTVVEALAADALAGLRLGLLHGSQPVDERRRVFDDLVHRRIDVLVSTLAVEDGPTVPGVSVVVIEQADRLQQWRLHRIIGALSVTPLPSVAVLVVGEHADDDAAAQISRIVGAPNGFALTESLVALDGVAAHVVPTKPPLPEATWLDLDADRDLVLAAREEAHRMLRADPGLRRGSHIELASEVRAAWDSLWPDAEGWEWSVAPAGDAGPADRRKRRRRRRRR